MPKKVPFWTAGFYLANLAI